MKLSQEGNRLNPIPEIYYCFFLKLFPGIGRQKLIKIDILANEINEIINNYLLKILKYIK